MQERLHWYGWFFLTSEYYLDILRSFQVMGVGLLSTICILLKIDARYLNWLIFIKKR
jgi:hypothetical protein